MSENEKVGFVLTVFGDEADMTRKALESFHETIDYPHELTVMGTNLSESCRNIVAEYDCFVVETFQDLSLAKSLNLGIQDFLQQRDVKYISWIHNDMDYCRPWVANLIKRLGEDKMIGKISPTNLRDGEGGEEHEGNECPWIIPTKIFDKVGIFDENFVKGGEKEDWDMNRRIKNMGYKVIVSPVSQVMHVAMATRFKYQTTSQAVQGHNHAYYFKKWGTHDPPC